ncbi:hypothetical protein L598_001000000100 [Mesorhizobium sp. J18]|uniref:hypothetical protein n=1 Tax=Mesorhizobium sp. J18 TaxID=935263 RepID=UPI00119B6C44|nr:hypothetical protein [Mesorhizobium sp. J18]TWH00572.1 hypothetical protein L598_001000000100 [Mesorhizobium sp. J18]
MAPSQTKDRSADQRKMRLAAELRANLARRKAQARSRRAGAADERPEGLLRDGETEPGKAGKKPANED